MESLQSTARRSETDPRLKGATLAEIILFEAEREREREALQPRGERFCGNGSNGRCRTKPRWTSDTRSGVAEATSMHTQGKIGRTRPYRAVSFHDIIASPP